jgi:TrmH family RNA methyltransferase
VLGTRRQIRLVLLRPRIAENLGAAARAMKNFGFVDWAWVGCEIEDFAPARRMAVHAEELLDSARRFASLAEAVADCHWVVGTTSRRLEGHRRLPISVLGSEMAERAEQGPVALVFGDERSGLTNQELERCHDISFIETDDAQPSVNLAQSVLLYAYEIQRAVRGRSDHKSAALPIAANDAELVHLRGALNDALEAGGFFSDERRGVPRELLASLTRSRLTRHEAQLWMAALKHLGRGK